MFEFWANGKKFQLPEAVRPLLETLERERECDLKHLYEVVGEGVSPLTIRKLIAQLMSEGILCLLENRGLETAE